MLDCKDRTCLSSGSVVLHLGLRIQKFGLEAGAFSSREADRKSGLYTGELIVHFTKDSKRWAYGVRCVWYEKHPGHDQGVEKRHIAKSTCAHVLLR